ncbi:MAG: carboxynorspermidine decarboxylase, partial [Verrucomicrobiota bacterium]
MLDELDPETVPSPCYVIGLDELEANGEVLAGVSERSGARILLALKAYGAFSTFPLISRYLAGASGSSPNEVRLAAEEFGKEVHACAPAYSEADIEEILPRVSHITFNSISQWERHRDAVRACGDRVKVAIRLNPEHSEGTTPIYDPCAPGSRLGVSASGLEGASLDGVTGFHFHTLCEQNSDALERTVAVIEERFGERLRAAEWVNLGGGHLITSAEYDVDRLCEIIVRLRERYDLRVYLEPGEAIALNAGVLVATVQDIVPNGRSIAILDSSATAHMPDVLEMPYRPVVSGAGEPGEMPHTYRLGGATCLAGDVIGDYSFSEPLRVGQRVVFEDMAHYTMVKNTTFNGVTLPAIATYSGSRGEVEVVREFGYGDFR